MSEHAELLKEARELADDLCMKDLPSSWDRDAQAATVLRNLADLVEAQDERDASLSGRIDRYLDGRLNVDTFDEAVAACRTCGRAIAKHLKVMDHVDRAMGLDTNEGRAELRAAGHLAKRAVELADKQRGRCVMDTMPKPNLRTKGGT